MTPNEALQALLSSFPRPDASDPALAATAYVFAIDGISAPAVVECVKRFIRGEVVGQDPRFCPTPAQIAQEARRIEARIAWDARRATIAPPASTGVALPDFSQEHRDMMAAKFRALSDRMSGKPSEGEAARYRAEIDARLGEREAMA